MSRTRLCVTTAAPRSGASARFAVFHGQRNLEWVYLKNTPAALLLRTLPGHLVYTAAAAVHFARAGVLGAVRTRQVRGAGRAARVCCASALEVQRTRRVGAEAIWPHLEARWLATKRREKRFDLDLAGDKR